MILWNTIKIHKNNCNMKKLAFILLFITLLSCSAEDNSNTPSNNDTLNEKENSLNIANTNIRIEDNENKHIKIDDTQKETLKENKIEKPTEKIEDNHSSNNEDDLDNIFKIKDSDIVMGNVDSKIILIEYSSLTCPWCSYYHQEIFPEIEKSYVKTGKIAYILREYIASQQDLYGSILARCGPRHKYYKFMEILYKQQGKWAFYGTYREILTNIGQLGGISPEQYSACIENQDITNLLIANSKEIHSKKIFLGTPTFFLNGRKITKVKAKDLAQQIDEEIERVKEQNQKTR